MRGPGRVPIAVIAAMTGINHECLYEVIMGVPASADQALGKGLRVFQLSEAEHHEVAVIAAQRV
jgi:hypothetical protein